MSTIFHALVENPFAEDRTNATYYCDSLKHRVDRGPGKTVAYIASLKANENGSLIIYCILKKKTCTVGANIVEFDLSEVYIIAANLKNHKVSGQVKSHLNF